MDLFYVVSTLVASYFGEKKKSYSRIFSWKSHSRQAETLLQGYRNFRQGGLWWEGKTTEIGTSASCLLCSVLKRS